MSLRTMRAGLAACGGDDQGGSGSGAGTTLRVLIGANASPPAA
jgi:hypothetical protein